MTCEQLRDFILLIHKYGAVWAFVGKKDPRYTSPHYSTAPSYMVVARWRSLASECKVPHRGSDPYFFMDRFGITDYRDEGTYTVYEIESLPKGMTRLDIPMKGMGHEHLEEYIEKFIYDTFVNQLAQGD